MEAVEGLEHDMDLLADDQRLSDGDVGATDELDEAFETDRKRLLARQKQIDFAKNTIGYERYLLAVPKEKRKKRGKDHDPPTPDITQKASKRTWDGMVKFWRRHLHKFDNAVVDTAAQKAVTDVPNPPAGSGSSKKRPGWNRGHSKRHKSNAQQQQQQQQSAKASADSSRGRRDTQHSGISKSGQQQHGNRRSQHRYTDEQLVMQESMIIKQEKTTQHKVQPFSLNKEAEPRLHVNGNIAAKCVSARQQQQVIKQEDPALPSKRQELQGGQENSSKSTEEAGDAQRNRHSESNLHTNGGRGSGSSRRGSLREWGSGQDYDRSYWGSKASSSKLERVGASTGGRTADGQRLGDTDCSCSGYSRSSSRAAEGDRNGRSSRFDRGQTGGHVSEHSRGCIRHSTSFKRREGHSSGSRSNTTSRAAQQQHVLGQRKDFTDAAQAVIKLEEEWDLNALLPAMRRPSWADCVSEEELEEGECGR